VVAGRKPKPSWLKVVTGNPGKRKPNLSEPIPTQGIGPPPEFVGKSADAMRGVWLEMVNAAPAGLLTILDRSVLEIFCRAKVRYLEACEKLDTYGPVIKSQVQGVWQQSPYYSIMKAEAKMMHSCMVEMGFTPSSRSRVSIAQKRKGQSETPFDDLKELGD
jgi:P27 family predicted phage terminase small subunit